MAKEHGFNFTQKEAASAQGELKKSLSPEELLEVSGGKGGFKSSLMAMALLAGLGVGGAAMSSMEASAMDGDNHQEIQVPGGQAAEQQQEGNAQPGQQQQGAEGNQEQPGQQNAPAQDEQQQQWVFDGRHTVDAGHYIEVQGPGGLLATGDSDRGFVVVRGDREVEVQGPGERLVSVFDDREVHVYDPGERSVAVLGDRLVYVIGPGQQTVHIEGDRPTVVLGAGQTDVRGSGLSQILGSGGVSINRPGGHTAEGDIAEIGVAPPVLQNPDRGPQEAPVYAPRDVELNEVGTATINGAQQAYINCLCDVTHSATGGNLRVTGDTMIRTEGNNHITAGRGSHVISFSVNELNHEGDGAVNIDRGDIVVSSTTMNDILGRNVTIENANAVAVNGAVSLSVTAVGDGGINISSDATVTHSADRGQINVTGGAVINAEGANRINAYEDTTIASTSANLLTHDGDGGVVIDGGAIEVSGSSLEQVERNVTVTMANSVTVNSGIAIRTQNGTEFTMGATREETIDNLIPDIQPSAHQERNTQQRNLNFNDLRLQRMLAWAMDRFDLSGQDLIDFVQRFFIQGG